MIGKAEWFERRKYGGWGLRPKTWQGWLYVAILILPFVIFQSIPIWDNKTRIMITVGWIVFLLLDVGHIMITLKRDEREHKIEALAERNAAWFMMLVIAIGVLYEIISSALQQNLRVNPFLVVALFGGALVKTVSNIVLEKKSL